MMHRRKPTVSLAYVYCKGVRDWPWVSEMFKIWSWLSLSSVLLHWPLLLCPQPIGAINFLRLPVCELYMTSKRFSNTGRILLIAVSSSLSLTLRLQNLKGQRFFMECAKFDVCPANVSYNIDKKNIWPTDQTTYFVTVYFLSDETAWDELVLRQTMITM